MTTEKDDIEEFALESFEDLFADLTSNTQDVGLPDEPTLSHPVDGVARKSTTTVPAPPGYPRSVSTYGASPGDDQEPTVTSISMIARLVQQVTTSSCLLYRMAVDARFAHIPLGSNEILIGRDESCQVRVFGHSVSRRHARLRPQDDRWIIEDMSTNGTILNGARLAHPTELSRNDQFRIGEHIFKFLSASTPDELRPALADAVRKGKYTDPLTGLGNRQQLVRLLEAEISRRNSQAVLALLAIDSFETLRMTVSSADADATLWGFAKRMNRHFAHVGHIGRIEAADFFVLFSGVDVDSVEQMVDDFSMDVTTIRPSGALGWQASAGVGFGFGVSGVSATVIQCKPSDSSAAVLIDRGFAKLRRRT